MIRSADRRGRDPAMPRLLGERLCLDFANTVEDPRDAPRDFLTSYSDLVRWSLHADLLTSDLATHLHGEAARRPDAALQTFETAVALRAAIQQTFAAIALRLAPAPDDLASVQHAYLVGMAHARLASRDARVTWVWDADHHQSRLDRMLWPVARSAVALLTAGSKDLERIKQCNGPDGCGWLFYDTSRNGSRRWCSMEGCGSRAKMRRYTARRRARD